MVAQLFESIQGLGAAGCFVLLVLYMMFQFMGKKKQPQDVFDKLSKLSVLLQVVAKQVEEQCVWAEVLRVIAKQTEELHKWHDQKDSDGVPVWYVRKSLEVAIGSLSTNIGEQTKVLASMINQMERMGHDVKTLVEK